MLGFVVCLKNKKIIIKIAQNTQNMKKRNMCFAKGIRILKISIYEYYFYLYCNLKNQLDKTLKR
jgi:hypothetical protein